MILIFTKVKFTKSREGVKIKRINWFNVGDKKFEALLFAKHLV